MSGGMLVPIKARKRKSDVIGRIKNGNGSVGSENGSESVESENGSESVESENASESVESDNASENENASGGSGKENGGNANERKKESGRWNVRERKTRNGNKLRPGRNRQYRNLSSANARSPY